jgi:cytidylate kinase
MTTITISRQFGAGGRTLGKKLAKRLGYYCADDVMVKEVADRMNVSPKEVQGFEKEGATNLMKILDKFISGDYISRLISDKYGYVYEKKYVDSVKSIIQGLRNKGNVVIIGRGSQYILQDEKDAFHILLVREFDDRVNFLVNKYDIPDAGDARKTVTRADKLRGNFLSFFTENENHDDPLNYDLTINMKQVSMDKAVDLILGMLS